MSLPRTAFLLTAAAVAVGMVIWWADPGAVDRAPAASTPEMAGPASPAVAGSSTALAPSDRSAPGGAVKDTEPPPGLSADQWQTVVAELAQRPDAAAERSRLHAYFTWSDAVQRWRDDRGNAALAEVVRAGLADRLARREVSAVEARLLEASLLATLEPDETRRAQALRRFDANLPAAAAPDRRELAYQRAQDAAVAAWRAAPAGQRDPAALNAELQRLRQLHFAQSPQQTHEETSR